MICIAKLTLVVLSSTNSHRTGSSTTHFEVEDAVWLPPEISIVSMVDHAIGPVRPRFQHMAQVIAIASYPQADLATCSQVVSTLASLPASVPGR